MLVGTSDCHPDSFLNSALRWRIRTSRFWYLLYKAINKSGNFHTWVAKVLENLTLKEAVKRGWMIRGAYPRYVILEWAKVEWGS